MLSVSKDDLTTLKKKNPNLIFIIGHPNSGKTTEIKKISNDFKYSHLDINKLIEEEIKFDSDLGFQMTECLEKGNEIFPNIICSLVVKGIIEKDNNTILIEGFPQNLEQALFFEQHILPINLILKLNCDFEVSKERSENPKIKMS